MDSDELFKKFAANAADVSPWKPAEARKSDREIKRNAVLNAATRIFLERGWNRATMQDLAERLNITKPALYAYFKSKEDLLRHCILLNNEKSALAFEAVDAHPGRGIDKLKLFIELHVAMSTSEAGACVNRVDDRDLSDELRAEFGRIKRDIDHRVRALVAAGVEDGSIVPCDIRLTTFALMGAVQWISRWYRPDGPQSSEEIAREFSLRLMSGLRPVHR
jgi:AcrR family transcriptional regulator